jgi:pilus assembly protein CpaB
VDDPAAGLLLIAVDEATAARLAAAATTDTLTVSLPPP